MIGLKVRPLRLAALLVAAALSPAAAEPDPTGLWYDHTGRGAIEITHCGEQLCGRLAWLKDRDNNQVCGRQIIGGLRRIGNGEWDKGWIYDPERDAKYDVAITPVGSDALKVVGYAGTKLFSETMTWRRAPNTLTRCQMPEVGAGPLAAEAPVGTPAQPATPLTDRAPAPERALARAQAPRMCTMRLPYVVVTFPCAE
jgi:uncharacterized protein (DUF2147 family)